MPVQGAYLGTSLPGARYATRSVSTILHLKNPCKRRTVSNVTLHTHVSTLYFMIYSTFMQVYAVGWLHASMPMQACPWKHAHASTPMHPCIACAHPTHSPALICMQQSGQALASMHATCASTLCMPGRSCTICPFPIEGMQTQTSCAAAPAGRQPDLQGLEAWALHEMVQSRLPQHKGKPSSSRGRQCVC